MPLSEKLMTISPDQSEIKTWNRITSTKWQSAVDLHSPPHNTTLKKQYFWVVCVNDFPRTKGINCTDNYWWTVLLLVSPVPKQNKQWPEFASHTVMSPDTECHMTGGHLIIKNFGDIICHQIFFVSADIKFPVSCFGGEGTWLTWHCKIWMSYDIKFTMPDDPPAVLEHLVTRHFLFDDVKLFNVLWPAKGVTNQIELCSSMTT